MNEGSDVTNVTEGGSRSFLAKTRKLEPKEIKGDSGFKKADSAPKVPLTCKPALSPEISRFLEGETLLSVTC